jgi:hypothetical protein
MTEPFAHATSRFELELQPESPGRPWRATLRLSGSDDAVRFDSPLALLRHLVKLTVDEPTAPHPRGLR